MSCSSPPRIRIRAIPCYFAASSDIQNVATAVSSNRLTITPEANFVGTARITVTAQDGPNGPGDWRGRTAEQTFDLSVGLGTVTGSEWEDQDRDGTRDIGDPGLEGVEVFLDINGNGILDRPGEPVALTDANGNYAFTGLEPGTYTVVERVPSNAIQTFDLGQAPVTVADINPGNNSSSPSGLIRIQQPALLRRKRRRWRGTGAVALRR